MKQITETATYTMTRRFSIFFILLVLLGIQLPVLGKPRSYAAPHLGFTLSLPEAFSVHQGRYELRDFVSGDFLQTHIDFPSSREPSLKLAPNEKNDAIIVSDSCNALVLYGPYDSYGILFATKRFISIDEIHERVLLSARTASGNQNVENLIRPSMGQYTLCALPANTLSLKRLYKTDGAKETDTLFTEIILSQFSDITYGVIMRSHENMAREANTTMRQIFLSVISGLKIHIAPEHCSSHIMGNTKISFSLPSVWSVTSRTAPFPMSEADFNGAGFVDSSMGTIPSLRRETPMLVVQLPTFQCEIFSHRLSPMDTAAWSSACSRALTTLQPPSALDPLDLRPTALLPFNGFEHSYSMFRRNDYVRTSWLVCRFNAQLLLIRIVAWQREVTAIAPVVDLLSRMSVAP